jgi:hypothetical protein
MTLLMRCNHTIEIDADKSGVPVCWCGERLVARALNPGVPRIVGHARGPLVESKFLGPKRLELADKPLKLKPPETENEHGR